MYYTPRLAGFQLGLGYTPDDKATASGGIEESGTGLNPDSTAGASEVVTIGVNYVNKFGGVDVALYGSYSDSNAEVSAVTVDDPNSWNVGAEFGYMGFSVGGSYLKIENTGTAKNQDRKEWTVGAAYTTGPWNLGVAYQNITVDPGAAFQALGVGDNEADYFSLGATYALGPGILLVGGVQWYNYDSGRIPATGIKTAADGQSTVLLLGTALSF